MAQQYLASMTLFDLSMHGLFIVCLLTFFFVAFHSRRLST